MTPLRCDGCALLESDECDPVCPWFAALEARRARSGAAVLVAGFAALGCGLIALFCWARFIVTQIP